MDMLVHCPAHDCFEGQSSPSCTVCGGRGRVPTGDCPRCGGSGELPPIPCGVCGGSDRVTRAFASLYRADERMRALKPDWDGDDMHGVTQWSLARWFRIRDRFRHSVTRARGRPVTDGSGGVYEVDLIADGPPHRDSDPVVVTFGGFCWGYGGEGPHGLATVLTDAGFFEDEDAAMGFVGAFEREEPWTLAARQVAR